MDYTVVSPQLLELVSDFAIATACPELDHIPLSLYLRCKSEKSYTCKMRYLAWEYNTKYMWSHKTLHDLRCILEDDLCNKSRIQFMDDIALMSPANEVAKSLTDYLTQAIDRAYPKHTVRPHSRRRGPAWFDQECREKRGEAVRAGERAETSSDFEYFNNKIKAYRTCKQFKNGPTGIISKTKLSGHFSRRVVRCGRYCLPPTIVTQMVT